MDSIFQDLRFGIRTLFKSPGFTIVALITLALGIGANSAIFSVINGVLLKPLPYPNPQSIVLINGAPIFPPDSGELKSEALMQWRGRAHSFEQIGAYGILSNGVNVTGGSEAERVTATEVDPNFFRALGVQPLFGRTFNDDEHQAGKNHVAVISHKLWMTRFGSDPKIVGKPMVINNTDFSIIGVMPASMRYPEGIDLWMPITFEDRVFGGFSLSYQAIGRLKPGVSASQAQAEVQAITDEEIKNHPDPLTVALIKEKVKVSPLLERIVGETRQSLFVVFGAVGFVLLIACVNVTNILLARGSVRRREIAIRAALGAGRWHLARQLLTESLLLSLSGGALGLLVALWGIDALKTLGSVGVPRTSDVSLDGRVFAFTLLTSIVAGIIFGLVPAFQASKVDLTSALKDGISQSGAGKSFQRVRSLLVISEIAMALLLLVGSGLLIKSFIRLQQTDTGFNSKNVLTASVDLPSKKYSKDDQRLAFFRQLIERLRHVPGAESVAVTSSLPFGGYTIGYQIKVDGHTTESDSQETAITREVSSDFMKVMQIPVLQGRAFTDQDSETSAPVAIVNDVLAKKYWPGENPIGKRITLDIDKKPREIVGVVPHTRHFLALDLESAELYVPYTQAMWGVSSIVIRTPSDPTKIVGAVRGEVKALDKDIPLYDVKTLEERLSDSIARNRFTSLLLGIFAAVALILAAVGIYGVISYSVSQRTHEIGVRLALGAQRKDVLLQIVKHGLILTVAGVFFGTIASYFLTKFMADLLYEVKATDPLTFSIIPVILAVVALAACVVPAIRATRVDPMVALRYE